MIEISRQLMLSIIVPLFSPTLMCLYGYSYNNSSISSIHNSSSPIYGINHSIKYKRTYSKIKISITTIQNTKKKTQQTRSLGDPWLLPGGFWKNLEIRHTQYESPSDTWTPSSNFWAETQKHNFQCELKENKHHRHASYDKTHNQST